MGNLRPTHIKFTARDGDRGYAKLKPDTTWTKAKESAKSFDADAKAKPVRRK